MSPKLQHITSAEADVDSGSDKKVWARRKPGKAEVWIYTVLLSNEWVHQYKIVKGYPVSPASADKWLKRLHDHKFLSKRRAVHAHRERIEYTLTLLGKDFVSRRLERYGLEEEISFPQTAGGTSPGSIVDASPKHVEVAATRLLRFCSKLAVGNAEAQALIRRVGSLSNESQKLQEATALIEEVYSTNVHHAFPKNNLEFLGNHFKLSALTALADGRFVTAGHDRAIRVWDNDPAKVPMTIQVGDSALALAALPQQTGSFVSADLHTLLLWNLASAKPKVLMRMKPSVSSAISVLANDRVALADSSPIVQIVDIKTGDVLALLNGHSRYIHTLLPLTVNLLMSASGESLVIWDLTSREQMLAERKSITSATAMNSEVVAYASDDYKICLLDISSNKVVQTLKGHTGRVEHLLSIGENHLASAGADRVLKVWDTSSGKCIFSEPVAMPIRKLCKSLNDLILINNLGDIFRLQGSVFATPQV